MNAKVPGVSRARVGGVVIVGGLMTIAAFLQLREMEEHWMWQEMRVAAGDRIAAIHSTLKGDLATVSAMADFLRAAPNRDASDFKAFTGLVFSHHASIKALEWAPRISDGERAAFEAAIRKEKGLAGFRITESTPSGLPDSAAARPEYYPVRFVEPEKGHEPALGFDLASVPERRQVLERARDSGEIALSGCLALDQHAERECGVLAVAPVFRGEGVPETEEDRRAALRGFAVGVFLVRDLVDRALSQFALAPVAGHGLEIEVIDAAGAQQRIALVRQDPPRQSAISTKADPILAEKTVEAGGSRWRLVARCTGWRGSAPYMMLPWVALAAGIGLTGALAAWVAALSRAEEEQRLAMEAMDASRRRLFDIVENMPVLFDAFDEAGNVVAWNRECEQVTGYPAAEMIGNSRAMELLYPDPHYRATMLADWRARGDDYRDWEWTLRAKNGAPHVIAWSNISTRVPVAGWARWGIGVDITRQKAAIEALRESERRFRSAFDDISTGMVMVAPKGRFIRANKAFCCLMGYSEIELLALTVEDLTHPEDKKTTADLIRKAFSGEIDASFLEKRYLRKDGATIWAQVSFSMVRDDGGTPLYAVTQVIDVTKTRSVEKALHESEATLRGIFDAADDSVILWSSDGRCLAVNRAAAERIGRPAQDIVGKTMAEIFVDPDLIRRRMALLTEIAATGRPYSYQERRGMYWFDNVVNPLRDPDGRVSRIVVIARDITSRKDMTNRLQMLQGRLEEAQAIAHLGNWEWNMKTGEAWWSEETRRIGGLSHEGRQSARPRFIEAIHPEDRSRFEEAERAARETGVFPDMEVRIVGTGGGDIRTVHIRGRVELDPDGKPGRLFGTIHDITRRKAIEEAVRREKERAETYLSLVGSLVVALDREGRVVMANRKACQVLGWDEADVLGRGWFQTFVPEERRQGARKVFDEVQAGTAEEHVYFENEVLAKDGHRRLVAWHHVATRDPTGAVDGVLASGEDISERVEAELARKAVEYELHQAQKMEALGQMAGGMAHEFNNMLVPVIGLTELAIDDLPPGSPIRANLETALAAGFRARDLIKKILAFSHVGDRRLEWVLLNSVVRDALVLLRAGVPSSIAIESHVPDVDIPVRCDPTDLHQVVMNLGTNARDALEARMDGHIQVRLETRCLEPVPDDMVGKCRPGLYAVLAVRDNGCGMDEATRASMFEPFFTTKEVGRGTGMGLSVVHGIVTGYGGGLRIESDPGKGTTVEVCLPVGGADGGAPGVESFGYETDGTGI